MEVRLKHLSGIGGRGKHSNLWNEVSKLTLPYYDGSGKTTARAWVQKVDTYFQLNPMPEVGAIRFAVLHMDGLVHEWWHHAMVIMGHDHITSYVEFIESLIELFDKKNPELHFQELAHLKQWGSFETYISYF